MINNLMNAGAVAGGSAGMNGWQRFMKGLRGVTSFMSDFLPFGNLIDTGVGLISGISNNIYDRQLQERLFQRDDTTLDRTMEAYNRNGINPLMALPNATAGNTKGFEPTNLQSNFNQNYLNYMQKKSLEHQETKMWLDNEIAKQDLAVKKKQAGVTNLKTDLEAKVLKAKLNGFKAYGHDYYPTLYPEYDLEYPEIGVAPADGSSWFNTLMKFISQAVDGAKDKLPSFTEWLKEQQKKFEKGVNPPAGTTTNKKGHSHSSGHIPRKFETQKKRQKNLVK